MRLFLALFLSCSLVAFGQKRRDHKVVRFSPGDVQAIVHNDIVTGYYFACLVTDGEFKRVYGVQLYDSDLKPTLYKEFKTAAYSNLDNMKSDGKNFCITFYNPGKGKTDLILLDSQLEQTGAVSLKNTKGEISSLYRVVAIRDVGFASYHTDKKRFCLTGYTAQGKTLWQYTSDYDEKKVKETGVDLLPVTGNILAFCGGNFRSMFKTDKNDQFLLFLDPATGRKILRMNLPNNVGLKRVYGVYEREDGYILTGTCNFEKNSGAALWHISKEGSILKERYVNVLEEANILAEALRNRGKYAVDPNTIHEIVVFDDNSAIVLAETAGDLERSLITCKLDPQWKVGSVNSIVSTIDGKLHETDQSDNNYSAYRYIVPSNPDKFSFVFVDSKNFSSNRKATLINADIKGSRVQKSEWKIVSDPTFFKVLPARSGHVVICEFHEKEKRLSLQMEEF
jgi:hypothetical protein